MQFWGNLLLWGETKSNCEIKKWRKTGVSIFFQLIVSNTYILVGCCLMKLTLSNSKPTTFSCRKTFKSRLRWDNVCKMIKSYVNWNIFVSCPVSCFTFCFQKLSIYRAAHYTLCSKPVFHSEHSLVFLGLSIRDNLPASPCSFSLHHFVKGVFI